MPTGSSIAGPLYLDSSAVVKLYLPEAESGTLNRILRGRRDALISDLAVTEIVSSLSRRRREGDVDTDTVRRLHAELLAHAASGLYRCVELSPAVHREAERLLLLLDRVALRAADALHLALALSADARTLVAYDLRLTEAAKAVGLNIYP